MGSSKKIIINSRENRGKFYSKLPDTTLRTIYSSYSEHAE